MPRKKTPSLRIRFLEIPKDIQAPQIMETKKTKATDKKYKKLRIARLTKCIMLNNNISFDVPKKCLFEIHENGHNQIINMKINNDTENQSNVDQRSSLNLFTKVQTSNANENQLDSIINNQAFNENDNIDLIEIDTLDSLLNFYN
ncbi:hypothetical protein M9Y10_041660 [Tritrichomonas musculus]|uniref:Uncharacterized protein n=1 Tax=Tritrichomonas musculus TaxID=1915356 RepID=A0ABR2K4Z6_9EUKA